MQIVHYPVEGRQMDRFDNPHVIQRDVQTLLGERPQLAATEAGAAECAQIVAIRPLDGLQNVGTVSGAADCDEQVARLSEILELLHKNAVEALIVSPSKDVGCVVR